MALPANTPHHQDPEDTELSLDDVEEVISDHGDDGDAHMSDDDDDGDDGGDLEVQLENHASGYFDSHTSSIFSISMHPRTPHLLLTGGGDDVAHLFRALPAPSEDRTTPFPATPLQQLAKHKDSVIGTAFLVSGSHCVTAGLDGAVYLYKLSNKGAKKTGEVREVEEISWIAAHPSEAAIVVGANDGSVWIYDVTEGDQLEIRHALYSFTSSCTAGSWSSDGTMVAAVGEEGKLVVWDAGTGEMLVGVGEEDARFAVDGGLFSVAVSPAGAVVVVGGEDGSVRAVGIKGENKGRVLGAVKAHEESVETLAFHPSVPLLASGSVDGNIVLYDVAKGYAVRGTLEGHREAVVKVDWVTGGGANEWILTSCGVDGTVRRWDAKLSKEIGCWKGHLGGNEAEGEGGVLGFVQTRDMVVTAGDDGVALIFDVSSSLTGQAGPTIAGASR